MSGCCTSERGQQMDFLSHSLESERELIVCCPKLSFLFITILVLVLTRILKLLLSFYGRPNISDVHVRKILWKYLWIPIFQTKNPFFCYLGVFVQKVRFLKKNSFCERIFLRPILTCTKTPNRFFDFSPHFFLNFFSKKIILIFLRS